MFCDEILLLAKQATEKLKERNKIIVTIESCTGGLVVSALTAVSGSSEVVHGGFVTYANEAKTNMVGVPKALIDEYGAISEQVAIAMAKGALNVSEANISISITGVAGPTGGTKEKPVGLVHFALANSKETYHKKMLFGENLSREEIRELSVKTALEMVIKAIS